MLKKAGHIVIIFLLIAGTGGVTISKHYCGSNLVGSSIFSTPQSCCNGPCKDCRNETKTIKITDTFDFTDHKIPFNAEYRLLPESFSMYAADLVPGHDLADLSQPFLPIKDPLIVRGPAGDPEAILQCFRL